MQTIKIGKSEMAIASKGCLPTSPISFYYTGYRLAFNYLKAKRLVDAIDVCHKVQMNLISFCNDVNLSSTDIASG